MCTEFECQNICKIYRLRDEEVPALQDVNFTVAEEEFICIVGPSGCGKTTLLKILAGLSEPSSGRIFSGLAPSDGRLHSAMVFQEHGLLPWLTALDNVAFGLEMQGVKRQDRRERARAFIEQIGLTAFVNNYPHQLSTGMRQRVGIARAFVTDPKVLLMDEPFSSLDAQTKMIFQEELLRIWKHHKKTVIYVTHDIEEAILLGDRVLVMTGHPGSIREEIRIPLDRPRNSIIIQNTEVMEIKWHIWKIIEDEVRRNL